MSTTDSVGPDIASWGYGGRRVVVTGAASGMGQAAASILVSLGAEVTGVDIKPVEVEGLATSVIVDLGDPASIGAAADSLAGNYDGLFNCAGIPGVADARTILAINFCGLRHLTERLVPKLNPGSAICNIGSTAAVSWPLHVDPLLELMAIDDYADALNWLEAHLEKLGYPYDVSKEAVNVYTAWRAVALNELGLRINCVNPGGTLTPASRDFTKAVKSKAFGAEMIAHWPKLMGRMAKPHEQAWPMVFLNSPFASFVTGASIYADGGLTSGLVTQQHHPDVAAGMFWRPPR
jgi:NAD(P)-dependent dehydrogenase (short-subunit alcohol dehydrogenase family)